MDNKQNLKDEDTSEDWKQNIIAPSKIYKAHKDIAGYLRKTSLQQSRAFSEKFKAKIFFKREDQQHTRSFKVRGALVKLQSLTEEERRKGVVCSTAGNQGAGVAFACNTFKVKGVIFLPKTISRYKIETIKHYGRDYIEVKQEGNDLNETDKEAKLYAQQNNMTDITLNQYLSIGCGTVAIEVLQDIQEPQIDYLIFSISSGSLALGLASYLYHLSPQTKLIGVQPEYNEDQPSHTTSYLAQTNYFEEQNMLKFRRESTLPFLNKLITKIVTVPEGLACLYTTQLYNDEGIVVEPYTAICPAALQLIAPDIEGKTVVCILSGSRSDVSKLSEIKTLSQVYEGTKHYLLVNFFRKPGALKEFISGCLGPDDEISRIEYTRKNNREKGPALVGIDTPNSICFDELCKKMTDKNIEFKILSPHDEIFRLKV